MRRGGQRGAGLCAAVLALGLTLALAGCGGGSSGATGKDIVGQGFVSGDGSVRAWPAGGRSGPVTLAGTGFDGAAIDTSAWRGDVVVVNTWYAGCAPCRAEAPDLARIAADYSGRDVHLLGINTTDDKGSAEAFERTFAVKYPSIEDSSGDVVAKLSGTVPLQAVPTTVILDRKGYVAARVIGTAEPSTLRGLIDDVLGEGGAGRSPSGGASADPPPAGRSGSATPSVSKAP